MLKLIPRSLFFVGIFFITCAVAAIFTYTSVFRSALAIEREAGTVRLFEANSRLRGQFEVFKAIVNIQSTHPELRTAMRQNQFQRAGEQLNQLSLTYGIRDVDLVQVDGEILSSSDPDRIGTRYTKKNLAAALNGRLGLTIHTPQRAFSYSRSIVEDGSTLGVVVLTVNLASLEFEWPFTPEPILFLDHSGISLSGNRPDLLHLRDTSRVPSELTEDDSLPLSNLRTFQNMQLFDFRLNPEQTIEVQIVVADVPHLKMSSRIFLDTRKARQAALMRTALVLALMSLAAMAVVLFIQQHNRLRLKALYASELEHRVKERSKELEAAQADLVEASNLAALGRLSAGLSHELNQPLAAMMNFAQNGVRLLALNRFEDTAENLNHITTQIDRITRIITNLRMFARQEIRPTERVDLVEIVHSAIALASAEIKANNVQLTIDIVEKTLFVIGGRVRLEQVIYNLISNAVDAMTDQTERRLLLTLKAVKEEAVLTVRDTGCGIKDPEKVFEPFYTTKNLGASKGLGMGLALSYGLIKSFKGDLICRNLTKGAEFEIWLPKAR